MKVTKSRLCTSDKENKPVISKFGGKTSEYNQMTKKQSKQLAGLELTVLNLQVITKVSELIFAYLSFLSNKCMDSNCTLYILPTLVIMETFNMGKSLLCSSNEACSAFLYPTFIVMFFIETFIMAGVSTTGMSSQHGTRLALLQ